MTLLAGHPQQLFFSAPVLVMTLALAVRRDRGALVRAVKAVLLTLVIGVGLAAAQILPQAELVANSHRRRLAYQDAIFGAVEGRKVWTILLPDFWSSYTGEAAGWIGLTGILLALAGIVWLVRNKRALEAAGWVAMTLFSLAMSAGGSTPLYRVMLAVWPGLDNFRFPLRFCIRRSCRCAFWLPTASMLCAGGSSSLLHGAPRRRPRRWGLLWYRGDCSGTPGQ